MPKLNTMSIDENFSFLFKGPPGMSKTCAAASAAVFGPIHLSFFDKNKPVELHKYFKYIVKRPELMDHIDYDIYGSANIHEWLNQIFKWGSQGCRYTAVITDSLTSLTGAAVNWSMGFRDPKGPNKDELNSKSVQLIPEFDEYKVETSMIVQALDILMSLPTNVIWTAHPLPQTKIEGSGRNMTVTKTQSLVTYGSKAAGMVPGRFTEIYHFGKEIDYSTNPVSTKYLCFTDSVGDDFARTALMLPRQFDITNRLFFEVWKEEMEKMKGEAMI